MSRTVTARIGAAFLDQAARRGATFLALRPRQKNDAIVQDLDSPGLTASLRFPLAPKEETWLPRTQGAAFGLALPFRAEIWLSAGLDQGHVGVGEAKMVTDLVDQHVADDMVYWLAVSVGVTEDRDR